MNVLPRTGPPPSRRWRTWAGQWIGFLTLALLLTGCSGSGTGVSEGITEGHQAPDFRLETLDGRQISLKELRGQVVLVNFWATWCVPCRAEIPDLEAVYLARRDEGFVVLGVNSHETRRAVEPFIVSAGVSYPILIDENGHVEKVYRPVGLPMSVLVDKEGIIQVRHLGLLTEDQLQEYLADLLP